MFCSRCGGQLADGARFCTQCGQPVTAESVAPAQPRAYTLTVARDRQWFAINPAVQVSVDGGAAQKLENGGTLRLMLTPGAHEIVLSCGIRNRVVRLNMTGDASLRVWWNRVTGSLNAE